MAKNLIAEFKVKELKSSYTIEGDLLSSFRGVNKPVMKKVLFGTTIPAPTSYRVYEFKNENDRVTGTMRTWVFGDKEINPDRFNVKFL